MLDALEAKLKPGRTLMGHQSKATLLCAAPCLQPWVKPPRALPIPHRFLLPTQTGGVWHQQRIATCCWEQRQTSPLSGAWGPLDCVTGWRLSVFSFLRLQRKGTEAAPREF